MNSQKRIEYVGGFLIFLEQGEGHRAARGSWHDLPSVFENLRKNPKKLLLGRRVTESPEASLFV